MSTQGKSPAPRKYVILRFARGHWSQSVGVEGFGPSALDEAREMARNLTASASVEWVEVITEDRWNDGQSANMVTHLWTRSQGWSTTKR